MKKILHLISSVLIVGSVSAQTYFSDDFEGGTLTANNAWNVQEVANPDAISSWVLGTVSGNYAKASNYVSSANHIADWWLISPAINLSSATTPKLSFDNVTRYAGPAMKVLISTNYDGSSAPSSATWTDITNLFTLDTDDATWTFYSSGEGDITAYKSSNTYIAFQYTGSDTDGATWEVDNVLIQDGATPPPTQIRISEVQATTGGDLSDMEGDVVTVGGRVSAVKTGSGFFIQDSPGAWNGIYVFDNGDNTVAKGDSVILTGTVAEYAPGSSTEKSTQIASLTAFSNEGANTPYAATSLTTNAINAEMYEGVLVTVTNGTVNAELNGFGEYVINDGSGDAMIDDFMYLTSPAPLNGEVYTVTGVIAHNFGEYKILPRDANDVTKVLSTNNLKSENISIYPNPSNGLVNVDVVGNVMIIVYNNLGQVVLTTAAKSFDLPQGVYSVNVSNETSTINKTVIVE